MTDDTESDLGRLRPRMMMNPSHSQADPVLSVVSPVYGAADIVDELVRRLTDVLVDTGMSFEIVLVDDRSPDGSWARIADASARDPRVRGVRLSRNFGQHRAIRAGLDAARGERVIVMDCDLQDDPAFIPDLLVAADRGYDLVYTHKAKRAHPALKNLTARLYFAVLRFANPEQADIAHLGIGAYSLLSRRVVDEYRRIGDAHGQYLMNLRALGFSSTIVEIEHRSRHSGKSSYSFSKLLGHAVDGVLGQSLRLLRLTISLGFVLFIVALLWACYLVVSYLVRGALAGYTSLMVAVLMSTAVLLMSIGVLGLYVGRIFEQVRGRPLYVVDVVTPPVEQ